MTRFEAPAKVNLSLIVRPPREDGLHPIDSLVQTVEWCDFLDVELGEGKDQLDSEIEDNLVLRALAVAREFGDVPPLDVVLHKEIPVEAGLGGGSSDAAAALLAAARLGRLPVDEMSSAASRVGADVSLFLTGGTLLVGGIGEEIEQVEPVSDFALSIVLPPFGLSTSEVYRKWDELEGPESAPVSADRLPPSLRDRMPIRNDLLPAALAVKPEMGDFISEVSAAWSTVVCMTGSGSACFGFFPTLDEAVDAVAGVRQLIGDGRGVALRRRGVTSAND